MRGTIGTLMTPSASRRSVENENVCAATGPSSAPRATSSSPADGPRSSSPRLVRHRPQQQADEQDDAQPNDAKPDESGAFALPACANGAAAPASSAYTHHEASDGARPSGHRPSSRHAANQGDALSNDQHDGQRDVAACPAAVEPAALAPAVRERPRSRLSLQRSTSRLVRHRGAHPGSQPGAQRDDLITCVSAGPQVGRPRVPVPASPRRVEARVINPSARPAPGWSLVQRRALSSLMRLQRLPGGDAPLHSLQLRHSPELQWRPERGPLALAQPWQPLSAGGDTWCGLGRQPSGHGCHACAAARAHAVPEAWMQGAGRTPCGGHGSTE